MYTQPVPTAPSPRSRSWIWAVDKGLAAFALTDHDTVAGVGRALTAARGKSLTVIPGRGIVL